MRTFACSAMGFLPLLQHGRHGLPTIGTWIESFTSVHTVKRIRTATASSNVNVIAERESGMRATFRAHRSHQNPFPFLWIELKWVWLQQGSNRTHSWIESLYRTQFVTVIVATDSKDNVVPRSTGQETTLSGHGRTGQPLIKHWVVRLDDTQIVSTIVCGRNGKPD